jgi:hypothetical protein
MTSRKLSLSIALVLTAALLAGCDDKKPEQPKVDSTPKPALPSADDLKKGVQAADTAATDAAKKAADATKTAAADATSKLTDASKAAAAGASDAAAAAKTQAADWIAKLEDAVKANKLDDAKTYVDKIDAIKANLPADLKSKFDSLKTMFDTAKAKAAGALPNLNK